MPARREETVLHHPTLRSSRQFPRDAVCAHRRRRAARSAAEQAPYSDMRKATVSLLLILASAGVVASPTDCGLLSLDAMVQASSDIAVGTVIHVSTDPATTNVTLTFEIHEALKGDAGGTILIDVGSKIFLLAPCSGPDATIGDAIVFLRQDGDCYVQVGGDGGVVHRSAEDYQGTVRKVRAALHGPSPDLPTGQ